jgi:hypothetical protein
MPLKKYLCFDEWQDSTISEKKVQKHIKVFPVETHQWSERTNSTNWEEKTQFPYDIITTVSIPS